MAVLPRPSSPRAVWRDIRAFLATGNRHKLLFGTLSVAIPTLLMLGFLHDSKIEKPKPEMWFVPSWPADRPDSVIIAQQKIDQAKKDKMLAEKRASYQRLAKRLGID
ncbi:hypothetical protein [Sphingomonas jatrophae]|nr:hypothetical protein [Sphingomonas jatrophae]